jgi:RNA recognition motif-containing protein
MDLLLNVTEVKNINSNITSIKIQTLADATIYVGGLDDKVTESLLWELFVQSGPLGNTFTSN